MKGSPIGFAAKTKTRGKSEGSKCGASRYAFSDEKWIREGYELFQNESVDFSRDYWVGKPLILKSELGFPNHSPAFWSCSNKIMKCLLFLAGRPDGHGTRPNSIKVATIPTLMTEIAKWHANLSQLAIQCNYRAAAARDMANVYSRNSAQRQIFVSKFDQKHFGETKTPSLSRMPHRYLRRNVF